MSICLSTFTKHSRMNSTLDVQLEQSCILSTDCRNKCKCNGKYLNDLWRNGRCAFEEIERLTTKLFKVVNSLQERDTEGLERVDSLYFDLKLNWITLDGLLQHLKYIPPRCAHPTEDDLKVYNKYCEKGWRLFYKCSELLVYARNKTGQVDPSENDEIIVNATLLKNFKTLPFSSTKQRMKRLPGRSTLCQSLTVS